MLQESNLKATIHLVDVDHLTSNLIGNPQPDQAESTAYLEGDELKSLREDSPAWVVDWGEEGAVRSTGNASAVAESEDWAKPTFSLMSLSNVDHFMVVHFHPTTTRADPHHRSESTRRSENSHPKKTNIYPKITPMEFELKGKKKSLRSNWAEGYKCLKLGFLVKQKDLRSKALWIIPCTILTK